MSSHKSLAAVLFVSALVATKASAQPHYQYPAKFFCGANIPGTSGALSSVVPGAYLTAVSVHNYSGTAYLMMHVVANDFPLPATGVVTKVLAPGDAVQIDCGSLNQFGIQPIHSFEGFLIIDSSRLVDVVALYTAGKVGGDVASMSIQPVPPRR